jgi:hypothetical protein
LIFTGLAPSYFRQCLWLYRHLGRLYDTRRTASPFPYDELFQHSQTSPTGLRETHTNQESGQAAPGEVPVGRLGTIAPSNIISGVPPYEWVRRVSAEPNISDSQAEDCESTIENVWGQVFGASVVEKCDYEHADFLGGMRRVDAERVSKLIAAGCLR